MIELNDLEKRISVFESEQGKPTKLKVSLADLISLVGPYPPFQILPVGKREEVDRGVIGRLFELTVVLNTANLAVTELE